MNPPSSGDSLHPAEAEAAVAGKETCLPFRDPTMDDAPVHLPAASAEAWAQGYISAVEHVKKALVERCSHSDMRWGSWEPGDCPFPGCRFVRELP